MSWFLTHTNCQQKGNVKKATFDLTTALMRGKWILYLSVWNRCIFFILQLKIKQQPRIFTSKMRTKLWTYAVKRQVARANIPDCHQSTSSSLKLNLCCAAVHEDDLMRINYSPTRDVLYPQVITTTSKENISFCLSWSYQYIPS